MCRPEMQYGIFLHFLLQIIEPGVYNYSIIYIFFHIGKTVLIATYHINADEMG